MRILFIGPPLYGLLYPLLSLAQAFRASGHDVVVASAGRFAAKVADAGLIAFDAAPELDSEAQYRQREHLRKKYNQVGNFSFFSEEMADNLVEFTAQWRPELIVYPPLGAIGPLLAAKFKIPSVMQTVGFAHTSVHINMVARALAEKYARHNVKAPQSDLAWIDIAPPGMTILQSDGEPVIPMRYVPFNGGAVHESWWDREQGRKRILVSLGTVKPMVDGLDLISWVIQAAHEVDAEFILQISSNASSGLRELPDNVRLVDWIPMGVFLKGADGFIHHGGAGNTLTALNSGIPQIVFGEGADRPVNAKVVVQRGCGIVPDRNGLSTQLVEAFLNNASLRSASAEVATEMAQQASPARVAEELLLRLQTSQR